MKQRVDWERHQAAVRQKEEEELERERLEYAAIDWHDFSVVETIDYQPWEVGSFPPPTTPQEVGRRVLLQERIEDGVAPEADMVLDSDEEEPEGEPGEAAGDRDDTQVQDMEEGSSSESDESDEGEEEGPLAPRGGKAAAPPLPKNPPQPAPVPPTPSQVVVKDYDPKQHQQQRSAQTGAASDEFLVSPITGERVPADKVGLHLKINMLDPRWLEDRDRQLAEKSNQETVFATGESVKSSLKQLAERRTDIFGAGDEETGIGKKIGEEEKREEKVTWDGHTASMEAATRAARAHISINEQIHQIHKVKGLLPDHEKEKIGPQPKATAVPAAPPAAAAATEPPPPPKPAPPPPPPKPQPLPPLPKSTPQPPPPPKPPVAQPMMSPVPMGGPMPPPMASMMQGGSVVMVPRPPVMMAPRQGFIPGGPPQVGFIPPVPAPQPPPPPAGMGVDKEEEDGPPTKKARTEESLVPEAEWARRHPGPIKFKVQVPVVSDKPEWKLNGQTLHLALPLTDPVSVVKARIHDETGLAPGKQKLARDGLFFKDALTLAYYNIGVGTVIQLQLKERGGRKK